MPTEPQPATSSRPGDQRPQFPLRLRSGLRERHPEALEAFFELYFEPIHRYLYRLLRSRDEAEDVAQEVFARIHERLPMYDPSYDPRPWAFAIATHTLRSLWRRRGRAPRTQGGEQGQQAAAELFDSAEHEPERAAREGEEREQLRVALQGLPEGERLVVHLRIFEEQDYESIGRALDLSAIAARKRYSRALARLRDILEPEASR